MIKFVNEAVPKLKFWNKLKYSEISIIYRQR
jgi:hypothetical protein